MYKNREAAWIGFEEAQRTIDALKAEVQIAEEKLSHVKRSLPFEKNKPFLREPLKISSSDVVSDTSNKKSLFIKENAPKKLFYHEKHIRKRRKYTVPKHIDTAKDAEDVFHSASPRPVSIQPLDVDQTVVKTVINSAFSSVSSSDTLDSLFNLKHKASSSERTSSLIADTYKNVDAEHSNIILRRKNSKIEDPSKITFTSWEEEFLKREIGLSGSEANLSQQDISSQDDIANRIEWTSMPVGTKVPNLKPKRIVHSDIKALHQIIDRQKKFHEKIQTEAQFPNPSLKNDLTVDVDLEKNEKIEENIISNDTDEVVQIKPPPIRKKCLVRNLPKYKGFSAPGDFSTTSARKTFKHIKQIHLSKDILIVHKEKQEKVAYKNKKLLSKTDQDNEQKVSIATNTDSQKSSSASDQAEVIKSKTDTLPSDDGEEVLKQNIAIALNLSSGNEMDSLTETKEIVDQLPKTPTAKSVKRKAKKPPDEKMTPSPKIRHYDPQAVRDYIKKKKAERKKRHLEERRKYLQEAERKKQSLQKLYQFQKQKVAISKSSSPSKVLKKTVEFPFQDEQSSLNVKKIHSGKQDQENEKDVLMHSKISEKPESYSFVEKVILSDSSSSKPLENENSLPKDRSFITEPSSEYKKKQKTSVTENIQPGIEFKSKMEKEKVFDIEEKHLHNASSSTSHYNEVERSSYISTISTPSKLTEFSGIEKLPGGSKYDKIVIPTGQSKQAETLKNLVKSINEMAEPFEHLIRTRKWIEESPPPPNHRPSAKSATSSYHQQRNPKSLKEANSSFVVDVAKSLHSAEGTSFKQQISKIGDTSGLYERLLGQPSITQRNETDSKRLMKSEQTYLNSVVDSNYEAELIEGSLESEDETDVKSLHQDNLIEGIGDNALVSHSEGNYLRYYNKEENYILPATNTLSINPDPFNFINTWNRKPIGIPALSNNLLEDFKTSDSPSHVNSTQDQFSKDASGSLAVWHESVKTGESLLNTAVNTPSLFDDSIIDSFDNNLNNQVEAQNEKSLDDRVSSQETSFYTSVASESYVSSNISSKSTSKQTESKNEENNKKRISPSESSVSEVISVIENSKNGEVSDIVIAKNDKSSELKFASENDIAEDIKSDENDIAEDIKSDEYDIAEDIKSDEYDIAEDIKSIENDVPEDIISDVDGIVGSKKIDENSFPKDKNSDSEISESLSSNSKISTDKSLKSLKGTASSLSLSKVSNEMTPRGTNDELSNHKEYDLPIPEKSSEDAESVTEQNKMESASGLSASSHNSITIDFAQPVRFTYSNGVSKSLKIHKGMPVHEEQYFHTQVVTRVASEAAAAAATSAVIAVFETQKELLSKVICAQDRSNNVLRTFSENTSVHSRTESASLHKTTSENSVSTVIESNSKSTSENSIIDEVNKNPSPLNTVREVKHSRNEENLPDHQSKLNKSSASSIISEDFPVSEKSEILLGQKRLRKISGNLSSPSPASLSENESISEVSLLRENSIPSSSTITESVLSDDSFAQLTLDVVRKITLEEELRATHQLALLKFQEQTLVENARAAMTWLESLKKNFREKGSTRKASFIKKKQKDIILRLRQERAQLRCMQEAYRSICDKHHSLIADKKKLLTEPIDLPYQAVKRKDKSHSSKASSEHKTRDAAKHISQSSSTSAVPTEEESRKSADEEIPVEELKISENGSNLEIIPTEPTASTVSSFNKSHEITPAASFPQLKQGQSQSSLSLNSNNSIESALQGLKKLEASKRHLTKREQRILQRRKHVEKILQWQMKLDSEEMAVRELEQKAVELVDTSKKKTKYYISSSPATGQDEKGKNSSNDTPGQSVIPTDTEKASSSLDKISSNKISSGGVSESVLSENSVPEENIVTATSADSVEEEFSKKGKIDQESSSILSSSSIQEINENQSIESSVKTVEDIAESSPVDEIIADEISPSVKSYTMKKSSSSDIYSESFESTESQKGMSPVPDASVKSSTSISNYKKEKGFTIKSPLAPRNFRRHDSSGSDDSYTISHSETASDQSDIEVRIHALAEELRRRKYEAEKLKREQKRKYREHLKGTELSLQKQVEAYNQYIQQVKYDLEHIEAMSSQSHLADISTVKPQIKWPRSEHNIDSRRIRKQTSLSSDGLTLEKKPVDNTNSSPESADTSTELPHMGKPLIKKLLPDSKEKLKYEINLNKDLTGKIVTPENTSEKMQTNSKNLSENKTVSPESSEQEYPLVSESLEISIKTLSSKKLSVADNKIPAKSLESKEESEIEEESYESTASLITIDSKSEQNKISSNETDLKITYQSDSFVSGSKNNQGVSDDNLKSSSAPDTVLSLEDTYSTKNSAEDTEETLQDSDNSHISAQIETQDSLPYEAEYISETSLKANTSSAKDDFESGSFEYENSDGFSSLSPRKMEKTFSAETESKIISEDNTSSPESKLSIQKESSLKEKHSSDEFSHVISNNNKKLLKENLKSETFVVNVVNYLYSSVFEDAVGTMFNLSKKYSNAIKPINQKYMIEHFVPTHKIKKLSDESVNILINELLSNYINDAISSIINISNTHENELNCHISANKSIESSESIAINSISSVTNIQSEIENEHKDAQSLSTLQDKSECNIFKKQPDWFEDGFVPAQWDTQQLEQQLLLQQYPYYYRKIPNKPPPPYTPPSVVGNTQFNYPLPIKKEKPVEKTDSVKYVTKHIELIIDHIADILINGKKNGLLINEITETDFSSLVERLNLTTPSQVTFLDLIFDVTKEISLDTFSEINETPAPWLIPRKLTPKPKFPTDKNKLITSIQKKVEEALKLLPTESFAEQRRKRPTWSTMKLGRKKRDFVDTILISEIKEEEPDWINYDQDEVSVKFQIADSIFDLLVDDTINLVKNLDKKLYW
ncbi:centrosome-associated protein 350 [Trichonephila inaurata madagascariensis]|uniref:Centrosome-associated protein 350 n=1 Tax=Trichonephila inaurata madagascariensis TaxID=2747483 RepID=A0A8X6YA59_9ARAC|nr:centrosome-associated protein 350 [Trichonephila inaurata madagascariensis]